jgi:succinate dehydrogenase/fumarate reductase iron-sulfur protein
MQNANVTLELYDPARAECVTRSYSVPLAPGATVLSVLLHIYENHDPTLAFRYGCRCAKCGECAVDVDGRPRLVCLASARDGMTISPLKNLPRVRDLIVDRSPLDSLLSSLRLYIDPAAAAPLGELEVPRDYRRLIGCLECYGCVSSCPHFGSDGFGGPYVFVRLAQLHLDPRDQADRRAQAVSLGVERCAECSECQCVKGIPIRRKAIATLLGEVDA